MSKQRLHKDKPNGISKESLLTIMGKLSAQQRAILSLKYFEDMNLGQASYILDIGYFRVLWLFLNAHIRLKLLLIMSGHPVITLKRLIAAFDKFTRN